jgi:hypothetical protein
MEEYGPNAIEEEKRRPALDLLSHFWGPIPWMIEIAAVLAGTAGKWEEDPPESQRRQGQAVTAQRGRNPS